MNFAGPNQSESKRSPVFITNASNMILVAVIEYVVNRPSINQSTSYILLLLSGAGASASFSRDGSSYSILSSSIERPSLIMR